ncbi:LysR family transcriptional regulator [Salinimicrobium xinjiangense]|uniref:LysR family transcriptional regulator n=1 Tax=Salinimicrobium xinjiangense TaxID=438596 RepID=UPI0003FA15EF|nr:LysR family transcriptional regulator [Salinimicrobium xinjiangense]
MHYTLHQLKVFLKVKQTGSITKAAEELHLSQPAVSIQIRNLQDQFDVPLLEIIGRKVFITQFGNEIAEASGRIIREIEGINSKAAAFKGELIGTLSITVVSTGKYVMPYFLSDYLNAHPGLELILDVTNRARVIESLEKNEVDFALVSLLPQNMQVEQLNLMDNKLFFVGGKNLITKQQQTSDLLTKVPLIFREKGSGTRKIMERFIKQHDLNVTRRLELTSNEAVKQAVIAGLGYSVMPLIGIRNELSRGHINIVPVEGFPINSTWKLIWLKDKILSPASSSFLKYLQQEKDRIIKEQFSDFDSF